MSPVGGPGTAWHELTRSPLFGIALTLLVYQLAVWAWERSGRRAVLHPVLTSIAGIATGLTVLGIPYRDYWTGSGLIGMLLGPATVALALPLYRQARAIRAAAVPILTGLLAGAAAAIVATVVAVRLTGGSEQLARSMATKSATTPVALALTEALGGIPALAAVFAILTGVLGAVAGPALLTRLAVRSPRLRGLAMGLSAHGIGTARALQRDPAEGAFAGLAMGLGALLTALVLPPIALALGLLVSPG